MKLSLAIALLPFVTAKQPVCLDSCISQASKVRRCKSDDYNCLCSGDPANYISSCINSRCHSGNDRNNGINSFKSSCAKRGKNVHFEVEHDISSTSSNGVVPVYSSINGTVSADSFSTGSVTGTATRTRSTTAVGSVASSTSTKIKSSGGAITIRTGSIEAVIAALAVFLL